MVEVTVARLGVDKATDTHVVILREKEGRRLLPIWIGKTEADAIIMELNDIARERPLTHDLCKSLILALGGALRRVTITRVVKSTYYAELEIEGAEGVVTIDARPSDSIAIALRLDAPIYAPDALLTVVDTADDDDAEESMPLPPPPSPELTAAQLKAYLAALRPEDFGKFSP